jgi:hypothetical protein
MQRCDNCIQAGGVSPGPISLLQRCATRLQQKGYTTKKYNATKNTNYLRQPGFAESKSFEEADHSPN